MPTITNEATLANILFTIKSSDIEICPGQKYNSLAPTGTPSSPKRPATARSGPKYSALAAELKRVLEGKVAALWSKDGNRCYCEFPHSSGEIANFLYDGTTNIMYCNTGRETARDICIPMLLYALQPVPGSSTFTYTQSSIEGMLAGADRSTKTVAPKDLGYVCETFYYDWLDHLSGRDGKISIAELDATMLASIQQNVRTNQMAKVTGPIAEFVTCNTQKIQFTPSEETGASASPASDHTLSAFFEAAKKGKYTIGFEWKAEQMEYIRPVEALEDYIPNESYQKMVRTVNKKLSRVIERQFAGKDGIDAIKSDYVNIIIGGRPGTGKTTTADALSATLGLPIYTAKVTKNTEEDTFEGMTKANSDGKFVVHDTAFLKAYQNGGIVVLEEFNLADPGVLQGAIGQAIEYPFILNRDGYQEVRRHPMCVVIATMNTGTQGAREPNQALSSRFPMTLIMDDPSEADFIQILKSKGHKESQCKKVYRAYSSILRYLKETANDEEMALCVTMRHCIAALEMVDDDIVTTLRQAVHDTMIGAIAIRDPDLANQVYQSAVAPLPLA